MDGAQKGCSTQLNEQEVAWSDLRTSPIISSLNASQPCFVPDFAACSSVDCCWLVMPKQC